jgi:plastocyanin
MPDWSIKIVPSGRGKAAAFVPDLQGAKAGDPLQAQQDDLITWNNTTNRTHHPWPTDSNYNPLPASQVSVALANYLSDSIPGHESSRPSYDAAQLGTIYYCCLTHKSVKSERGTIVVSAVPT